MTLLVSSAHPAAAGVQAPLVEALCRGGAKPDGPDEDSMPLWTAISSWYPKAVDALIRCGARVDNLLFAGAAGDLPAVRSYFDEAGGLLPERAFSFGRAAALAQRRPPEKTLHPRYLLEYALHWAVAFRRRPVAEYLLGKRPITVIEPTWNNTLLESAKYSGDSGMEALIAPLFAPPPLSAGRRTPVRPPPDDQTARIASVFA